MTPDLRDLAAAVVALPGWEWRPGMRYLFAAGKLAGKGLHLQNPGCTGVSGAPPEGCVPDLTDPATAGAMLGLLPGQRVSAQVTPDGWFVMVFTDPITSGAARAATFGEAIARMVVARGWWR